MMLSKKLLTSLCALLIVLVAVQVNGDDRHGKSCARNAKSAWLDLVIVIELTPATLEQHSALMGNLLSDLSQFNIAANGDHTTRVALVTYNTTATVAHAFTDTQNLAAIKSSFDAAVAASKGYTGQTASIAAGLKKAYDVITQSGSNRIPGVVLFAATYDNKGTDNPIEAALTIKGDMINLATVTFEAANGVVSPDIAKLASDGLALNSKQSLNDFAKAVATLNCVCSPGWTRLIINSSSERFYSDCFFAQDTQVLPAFIDCGAGAGLVTVNTPERLEFITDTVIPDGMQNPKFFSIGLTRTDASASWQWFTTDNTNLQWTTFPLFSSSPLPTDVVGYMHNDYGFHWELKSDDSYTNSRPYICQKAACDTNNICDRQGNFRAAKPKL